MGYAIDRPIHAHENHRDEMDRLSFSRTCALTSTGIFVNIFLNSFTKNHFTLRTLSTFTFFILHVYIYGSLWR